MTSDGKNDDDWPVVARYTDGDALRDGVLVALESAGKDTGHRITRGAYEELRARKSGYTDDKMKAYVLHELLPLEGAARRVWDAGSILKTTYRFRVTRRSEDILWYVPNEVGGVTVMKPEDY